MIYLNAIAVLAHIALGLYVLRRHVRYTVFFGYFFFVQTWSVASCFYNDLGIYNFELFRYTETTLATSRLALFMMVFNLGFLIVARYLDKRPMQRRDYAVSRRGLDLGPFKLAAMVAVTAAVGYVVYDFATNGVPLLQGIHRLLFLEETGPVERWLVSHSFLIAFVLGYYRKKRRWISFSGLMILFSIIYLLAIGNKFTAFIRVLVPYFAAVFVVYLKERPDFSLFRKRTIVTASVVVVLSLLSAYGSYIFWGQGAEGSAAKLLTERVLSLQGHLWWATDYHLFVLDGFDPTHWRAELAAIISPSGAAEGSFGMKYVMIQAIGAENAFRIFDIGYLYTMAYPAILTLTFPYPIALLVQLLAGMAFAPMLWYFHYSVRYRHFLRGLAAIWVILPFVGAISTGDMPVIFAPPNGIVWRPLYILLLEVGLWAISRPIENGQTSDTDDTAVASEVDAGAAR